MFKYKHWHSGVIQTCHTLANKTGRVPRSKEAPVLEAKVLSRDLTLPKLVYKDIRTMLTKGIVPKVHHPFYLALPEPAGWLNATEGDDELEDESEFVFPIDDVE